MARETLETLVQFLAALRDFTRNVHLFVVSKGNPVLQQKLFLDPLLIEKRETCGEFQAGLCEERGDGGGVKITMRFCN